MASFSTAGKPKSAASILCLAALIASPVVHCQLPFEPIAYDDRQAEIVDDIRAEQTLNGVYSAALVEPLTALSFLYQESGDHTLAIAAIERALQVQRVNYGLRTLDQAPLIQQWIDNAERMGDVAMAWDLEQALIALVHRHPNDLRAVPILREFGDKRMDLLVRYAKGELPPQVVLGCYYDPVEDPFSIDRRVCHSGSRRVAIQAILREAQSYYRDAIRVMQRNDLYSSEELRELEMEVVRTSYLHGYDPGVGRRSLTRVLAYDVASNAPAETRVASLVQMADWDLMFANGRTENGAVLANYETAYRELEKAGGSQTSIVETFSPETPVVLPAFLPSPLKGCEQAAESKSHIDVAFEIDKFGKSDRIKVVGSTDDVTNAAKRNLVRVIARSRFRPQFAAGQVAEDAPVVVRYCLDES
jgi:tetratricopeptide (TPR) repeat protein